MLRLGNGLLDIEFLVNKWITKQTKIVERTFDVKLVQASPISPITVFIDNWMVLTLHTDGTIYRISGIPVHSGLPVDAAGKIVITD